MTPKQFYTRLRTAMKVLVWEGTSNLVFGNNVFISPQFMVQQLPEMVCPSLFIVDKGFVADEYHPGIGNLNFNFVLFVENVSDRFGEGVILGANRTTNTSRGAGVLDIVDEVFSYLFTVTALTSKVMVLERSIPNAVTIKGNLPLVTQTIALSVYVGLY